MKFFLIKKKKAICSEEELLQVEGRRGSARLSVTCCPVPGWRSEVLPRRRGSSLRSPPEAESPESALREQGDRLVQVRGPGQGGDPVGKRRAGPAAPAAPAALESLWAGTAAALGWIFLIAYPTIAFSSKGFCLNSVAAAAQVCHMGWMALGIAEPEPGPAGRYPRQALSRLGCPRAGLFWYCLWPLPIPQQPWPHFPSLAAAWSSRSLFLTAGLGLST